MPKYIDIHSHVNFKAFDEDRDEVIKRAFDNDTWIINVGTHTDTSKKAIEMAHKYGVEDARKKNPGKAASLPESALPYNNKHFHLLHEAFAALCIKLQRKQL